MSQLPRKWECFLHGKQPWPRARCGHSVLGFPVPSHTAICTFPACFAFPEVHFQSCRALRWYHCSTLSQLGRGESMESSQTPLTQQFRAQVLMEPLICWKYHLKLSTALSDWVNTTGFWVNNKGFDVSTSCEAGTGHGSSRSCSWHTLQPAGFQRDGTLRPSWSSPASPAAPSSPDHHIGVPSVPEGFSVSLGSDKMPHVSPEIYIHALPCVQRSPLVTGMVTRQSVRGNKKRFPKPDIINSVLHPSWCKTSTKCKYQSEAWRLLQVLLAL